MSTLSSAARALWAIIKGETVKDANTATRVGAAGEKLVDAIEERMLETEFVGAGATKKVASAETLNGTPAAQLSVNYAASARYDNTGKEIATYYATNASITQLIDGATDDTLKKLQDKITALQAIVGSSSPDGDSVVNTVAELLAVFSAFPEAVDVAAVLASKVNATDIYNALDAVVSGKVLDARQGKVLNEAIAALSASLANKVDKNGTDRLVTTDEITIWNKDTVPLTCSDENTDIIASTTVAKLHYVFRDSFTRTINSIVADLTTVATGSLFTIDIKKNGNSIFSTLLTIDSGESSNTTALTPYVLTGSIVLISGDYVDVYVTLVGSVTSGRGLKINLITTKS